MKITTKPKLLAHLQNKWNQNENRHKTKKQHSIKSKNKRQGIIELTYQIHMSRCSWNPHKITCRTGGQMPS
jgi:hypothetical protein